MKIPKFKVGDIVVLNKIYKNSKPVWYNTREGYFAKVNEVITNKIDGSVYYFYSVIWQNNLQEITYSESYLEEISPILKSLI